MSPDMDNAVKIIIYGNDGSGDEAMDSIKSVVADVVAIGNEPDRIDSEILTGNHRVVILMDDRNSFNSPEGILSLVRSVPEMGLVSPIFMAPGCKGHFIPSVLDVHGRDQPFFLSWDSSPSPDKNGKLETRCLMGCCQAFRREWFKTTGGFNGITEPDNRDIFISLVSESRGGKCLVSRDSIVTRRFGNPVRNRKMGKEMLKMAFLCLPHNELQGFLQKYVRKESFDEWASPEEVTGWINIRMRNETL